MNINIIAADSEDILILRLYSHDVASDNASQVPEHAASSCFQFDNELTSILTFSMYSILPYILGYHFAKLIH